MVSSEMRIFLLHCLRSACRDGRGRSFWEKRGSLKSRLLYRLRAVQVKQSPDFKPILRYIAPVLKSLATLWTSPLLFWCRSADLPGHRHAGLVFENVSSMRGSGRRSPAYCLALCVRLGGHPQNSKKCVASDEVCPANSMKQIQDSTILLYIADTPLNLTNFLLWACGTLREHDTCTVRYEW